MPVLLATLAAMNYSCGNNTAYFKKRLVAIVKRFGWCRLGKQRISIPYQAD